MTTAVHPSIPATVALGGYDGEMASLYALESENRQNDVQTGKTRVQGEEKAEQKACEDAHEAIRRAEEAESQHGFWNDVENALGDVAKVAGAVAAAATAVATGGVGAAVLVPVAEVATTTAGVSELATAGTHVVSTHYATDAQRASADAEEGTLRAGRLQVAVSSTIDDIRDVDESHRRVEQTLQGTIQINDRTSVDSAASLRIRG
jgi:hypothetical protein